MSELDKLARKYGLSHTNEGQLSHAFVGKSELDGFRMLGRHHDDGRLRWSVIATSPLGAHVDREFVREFVNIMQRAWEI